MNKTDRLKQAYLELKSGKIIEFIPDNGINDGVKCWIQEKSKRKYIFWEHYGVSANPMNLDNLRWIAKAIGGCSTYNYKIIYVEYVKECREEVIDDDDIDDDIMDESIKKPQMLKEEI